MSAADLLPILEKLDSLIFLLTVNAIAVSFNWGVLVMLLFIQTKNQRSLT